MNAPDDHPAPPGPGFSDRVGVADPALENWGPRAAGRGGVALEKAMLYITWLIPVLEQFPRSQRFLLGDRLQNLA